MKLPASLVNFILRLMVFLSPEYFAAVTQIVLEVCVLHVCFIIACALRVCVCYVYM